MFIKHPDKRFVEKKEDQVLEVNIQTRPANPPQGKGITGEDVFRFDTEVTIFDRNHNVVPSNSTFFYFDVRGNRRQNTTLIGESIPIVETVDVENQGTSEPEQRSATVEVNGLVVDIDYEVQNAGASVIVIEGSYTGQIVTPGLVNFDQVPAGGNKPVSTVVNPMPRQNATFILPGY